MHTANSRCSSAHCVCCTATAVRASNSSVAALQPCQHQLPRWRPFACTNSTPTTRGRRCSTNPAHVAVHAGRLLQQLVFVHGAGKLGLCAAVGALTRPPLQQHTTHGSCISWAWRGRRHHAACAARHSRRWRADAAPAAPAARGHSSSRRGRGQHKHIIGQASCIPHYRVCHTTACAAPQEKGARLGHVFGAGGEGARW